VDKSTGVRSDHTVILSSFESASVSPDPLRRVSYLDAGTVKRLIPDQQLHAFGADHRPNLQAALAGGTVRKWIKQHLRIKAFYGTSENAVKTQIWIAVSVYVLGHRAQTARAGGKSAPNPTDSQPHAFRENAHFMRPSGHRHGHQFHRKSQPTDSTKV
jgi:hypothetical protein